MSPSGKQTKEGTQCTGEAHRADPTNTESTTGKSSRSRKGCNNTKIQGESSAEGSGADRWEGRGTASYSVFTYRTSPGNSHRSQKEKENTEESTHSTSAGRSRLTVHERQTGASGPSDAPRRQKSQHPQESITQTQRGESIREAPIKGHANKTAGLPPSPSHQQCEKAHLEQLLRELAAKRTGGPWAGPWGTARTPEETGGSAG